MKIDISNKEVKLFSKGSHKFSLGDSWLMICIISLYLKYCYKFYRLISPFY